MNDIKRVDLKAIRELLDEMIFSSNKIEGEKIKQRLESKAFAIRDQIGSYELGKLNEAISYAFQASGQVRDKEHWKDTSMLSWYVFERSIESKRNE